MRRLRPAATRSAPPAARSRRRRARASAVARRRALAAIAAGRGIGRRRRRHHDGRTRPRRDGRDGRPTARDRHDRRRHRCGSRRTVSRSIVRGRRTRDARHAAALRRTRARRRRRAVPAGAPRRRRGRAVGRRAPRVRVHRSPLDPDHAAARRALGFEREGGAWVPHDRGATSPGPRALRRGVDAPRRGRARRARTTPAARSRPTAASRARCARRPATTRCSRARPRLRWRARRGRPSARRPRSRSCATGRPSSGAWRAPSSRPGRRRDRAAAARSTRRWSIPIRRRPPRGRARRRDASATTTPPIPFVKALHSKHLGLVANAARALAALGDRRGLVYLVKRISGHGDSPRVVIESLTKLSYIRDYDVEIAQAANIANPVVGTATEGIVFDIEVLDLAIERTVVETILIDAFNTLAGAHATDVARRARVGEGQPRRDARLPARPVTQRGVAASPRARRPGRSRRERSSRTRQRAKSALLLLRSGRRGRCRRAAFAPAAGAAAAGFAPAAAAALPPAAGRPPPGPRPERPRLPSCASCARQCVRTLGRPVTASPAFQRPSSVSLTTRSQRERTLRLPTRPLFFFRLLWIDMGNLSSRRDRARHGARTGAIREASTRPIPPWRSVPPPGGPLDFFPSAPFPSAPLPSAPLPSAPLRSPVPLPSAPPPLRPDTAILGEGAGARPRKRTGPVAAFLWPRGPGSRRPVRARAFPPELAHAFGPAASNGMWLSTAQTCRSPATDCASWRLSKSLSTRRNCPRTAFPFLSKTSATNARLDNSGWRRTRFLIARYFRLSAAAPSAGSAWLLSSQRSVATGVGRASAGASLPPRRERPTPTPAVKASARRRTMTAPPSTRRFVPGEEPPPERGSRARLVARAGLDPFDGARLEHVEQVGGAHGDRFQRHGAGAGAGEDERRARMVRDRLGADPVPRPYSSSVRRHST